jgi:hypothetical protein
MSIKRWIAGLGAVLLVEIVVALVLSFIAMEENCNNGVPRWQCSESLKDLLGSALIVIPLLYVTLFVIVAMRNSVARHEGGTSD